MIITGRWYAIETNPRCENKVTYLLTQKGYNCFFPKYTKRKKWLHNIVEISLPLFPRYIFIYINQSSSSKIITTPGVNRIISFGGIPVDIPENEISHLQMLDQSDLLRRPWEYIPTGTLVTVETGPLAGVEGILKKSHKNNKSNSDKSSKKIILSISLLQRSILVELAEDTVLSVKDTKRMTQQGRKKKRSSTDVVNNINTGIILKLIE